MPTCFAFSLFFIFPVLLLFFFFFFFNDTATTEIYTLSLHDALPIFALVAPRLVGRTGLAFAEELQRFGRRLIAEHLSLKVRDRKSTRLNSSHSQISYAVFCLKKKKKKTYAEEHPHRRSTTRTY